MANIYTPVMMGFAQSTYLDQQGTALPGSLAFCSDTDLIDSFIVDPDIGDLGLTAGIGVVIRPAEATQRAGLNNFYVGLPDADSTAADFAGVLIRNQQMGTNGEGQACWFGRQMCNVARASRVGARIWVPLNEGSVSDIGGGAAHWIIADSTGHGQPIGSFTSVAITGDTILLTKARFISASENNSPMPGSEALALLEIGVI